MPTLPTTYELSTFQPQALAFGVSQLAASQSAVAAKINVNAATSGAMNVTSYSFAFPGWIVGVRMNMTANKTAGVFTVTPTINGTALTTAGGAPGALVAAAVANTTKTLNVNVDAGYSGCTFKAGDLIGLKYTTDGSYTPTTNDVLFWVDVVLFTASY